MSSKRYTSDFRAEAIWQATERGEPRSWIKGVNKTPRLATKEDLRAENARLKAEFKRVVEERDILNKTAEYFAKAFGFGRNERFA